jgi:hypothetical protein
MRPTNPERIPPIRRTEAKQKYEADQQKMEERRAQHMHGGSEGAPLRPRMLEGLRPSSKLPSAMFHSEEPPVCGPFFI